MGIPIIEHVDGHCCYVCTFCKTRLFLSNYIDICTVDSAHGECYGVQCVKNVLYTKTSTMSCITYSQTATLFDYDSPLQSVQTRQCMEVACILCKSVVGWFHRDIHIIDKASLNVVP